MFDDLVPDGLDSCRRSAYGLARFIAEQFDARYYDLPQLEQRAAWQSFRAGFICAQTRFFSDKFFPQQ